MWKPLDLPYLFSHRYLKCYGNEISYDWKHGSLNGVAGIFKGEFNKWGPSGVCKGIDIYGNIYEGQFFKPDTLNGWVVHYKGSDIDCGWFSSSEEHGYFIVVYRSWDEISSRTGWQAFGHDEDTFKHTDEFEEGIGHWWRHEFE